jgi:hypothetical protein
MSRLAEVTRCLLLQGPRDFMTAQISNPPRKITNGHQLPHNRESTMSDTEGEDTKAANCAYQKCSYAAHVTKAGKV